MSTYGLCDTLDVVAKNLAVTLSAALAETLYDNATVSDQLSKSEYQAERTLPPLPRPDMLLVLSGWGESGRKVVGGTARAAGSSG